MGALETDFSALASFALTTGADVVFNEPMSKHTTFQIGGPAAVFIRPEDEESLQKISTYC
ncbi:MAG TPA: UDP-N-acetylenolpyruvoylglucosamine reductase, partial [Ruminococcaceae bacterium]|nr:UDP-N-acetylenolpyruvoylglucosamine reductase [Oscillospiraceae bacterium]